MTIADFTQNMIPLMLLILAMLTIFGLQPNNNLLSIWSDQTYSTPGKIGNTDINTSLEGTTFATQTSTGLIEDNNPFLNLISSLGILPKIAHTFQVLSSAFSDAFNFLPQEIRWVFGLPLLATMTIGLLLFLLNASGVSKGGGA